MWRRAYKQLIEDWRQVLPIQSVYLQIPIVIPRENSEAWASEQKAEAAQATRNPNQKASKAYRGQTAT